MRAAAVAVLLVVGAAFASLAVGDSAFATCPTPNPHQTSSSVGVQIGTPSDSPSPDITCAPDASSSPVPQPSPGSTDGGPSGGMAGSTSGGTAGGPSGGGGGSKPVHRVGPAVSNTPQAATAGASGAPSPGYQPVTKADPLTVTPDPAYSGDKVLVAAAGFAAGEKVQLVLYPSPVIIGSYIADLTGAFRVTVTMPVETKTGPHTIEATGWVSHHAANGPVLIVSRVEAAGSASSLGWLIGIGSLLVFLIMVTVFVFRSSIARMFTPPRAPEPAS